MGAPGPRGHGWLSRQACPPDLGPGRWPGRRLLDARKADTAAPWIPRPPAFCRSPSARRPRPFPMHGRRQDAIASPCAGARRDRPTTATALSPRPATCARTGRSRPCRRPVPGGSSRCRPLTRRSSWPARAYDLARAGEAPNWPRAGLDRSTTCGRHARRDHAGSRRSAARAPYAGLARDLARALGTVAYHGTAPVAVGPFCIDDAISLKFGALGTKPPLERHLPRRNGAGRHPGGGSDGRRRAALRCGQTVCSPRAGDRERVRDLTDGTVPIGQTAGRGGRLALTEAPSGGAEVWGTLTRCAFASDA